MVEFFFIWKVFSLPPAKALLADIAANTASALLGVVLIPLAGMGWEFFPGLILSKLFHIGTFNPIKWSATYVLACLINALLESYTLELLFKLPFTRKTFSWLVLANSISVGIAFANLHQY